MNEEAALGNPTLSPDTVDGETIQTVGAVRPPRAHLSRRNDLLLVAAVAAYAFLLLTLMVWRGIAVTPDLLVVSLALVATVLGRGKLFLRDWIPFIALFLAYELMRGYADKFGLPIHVSGVISIDRLIGLGQLPTHILQELLHSGPATSPDNLATISVIFYCLHFPLPLAIGFLLWMHHRRLYYDFVAALIVLSMAAFITFLLVPVAPPWWAAQNGYVTGVLHLSDAGFQGLTNLVGVNNYFFSYQNLLSISSDNVAAFPSLHAAYPFLAFLFARRAFGKVGWLMLAYSACVWVSIVYLGEHWVTDIIGGVIYASSAYLTITRGPRWGRRFIEKIADEELEAGVEAEEEGDIGALRRLGRHARWALVTQGLAVAIVGAGMAYSMSTLGWAGGSQSALYLLPWLAVLGGLWRSAAGLLSS